MERKEYFYIFDNSVELFEVFKKDNKLFLNEELEDEVSLDFNDDKSSLFASWWIDCEEDYTSIEVFSTREAAVNSLRKSLRLRISQLEQKLAALE